MFEPLQNLLSDKADSIACAIRDIVPHLAQIVRNTETEVNIQKIGEKSDSVTCVNSEGMIRLRPAEGFMWRLTQIAVTGKKEGACAVYLGAAAPTQLIDIISNTGIFASARRYYVPLGSEIIFHFYEQEEKGVCTAHIQVEEYDVERYKEAYTGPSSEYIEMLHEQPPVPDPLGQTFDEKAPVRQPATNAAEGPGSSGV